MRKLLSLSAIAVVLAVGTAIASKPPTTYEDANGNPVPVTYYNQCGNTSQPLCATKFVNGIETEHRNSPIP